MVGYCQCEMGTYDLWVVAGTIQAYFFRKVFVTKDAFQFLITLVYKSFSYLVDLNQPNISLVSRLG